MKIQTFTWKAVNLLLILLVLACYQVVQVQRAGDEEAARLNYEMEVLKVNSAAAEDSAAAGGYTDGVYSGIGTGFGGDIAVEVEVTEGRIADVRVLSAEGEDSAYLEMAEGVIDEILEAQSAEVDTVSGATFSSGGILAAVEQALSEAGKEAS